MEGGKKVTIQKDKKPHIDKQIRPLVTVLNKFSGITTISSCEGHDDDTKQQAFVLFLCDDITSLKRILSIDMYDIFCKRCARKMEKLMHIEMFEIICSGHPDHGMAFCMNINIEDKATRFLAIKLITDSLKNILKR